MPLLEPVCRPVGADAKVCMHPQALAWDLVAVTLDKCAGRKSSVDASFTNELCSGAVKSPAGSLEAALSKDVTALMVRSPLLDAAPRFEPDREVHATQNSCYRRQFQRFKHISRRA